MSTDEMAARRHLMPSTRLVVVEGIPGSGKSTAAQFINVQLRRHGVASRWYHEGLKPHPVYTFYDGTRHRTADDYSDDAVSRWQTFVGEVRSSEQVCTLDAALFQNHVRSMLYHDCGRQRILALGRRIESIVSVLDPVLLYLRPADVQRTLRDICRMRGERLMELWLQNHDQFPYAQRHGRRGYAGIIAFWNEFRALSDRLFAELDIRKLAIDTSGRDWGHHRQQICELLDLPPPERPPSEEYLDRFVGSYVHRERSGERGFTLLADSACLVARSEQASMRVDEGPLGCFREVRFIPKRHNVFYVAGWPFEATFAEDYTGSIRSVRLAGAEDGRERSSEVFIRRPPENAVAVGTQCEE